MSEVDSKDLLYASGIVVTFILGAWNAVQNFRASRKTSFINTVTSQRVLWLEQLRQDVSRFVGLTHHWTRSGLEGTELEKEILREIDQLRYVIRMRLNPSDKPDIKIAKLVKLIPDLTHESKRDELFQALDQLTDATQDMLKEEWEKVKKEAKHGDISDSATDLADNGDSSIRVTMVVVVLFVALASFGVGVVAPLTPSSGHVETSSIVAFWILPMLLAASVVWAERNRTSKSLAVLSFLVIFILGGWVLRGLL